MDSHFSLKCVQSERSRDVGRGPALGVGESQGTSIASPSWSPHLWEHLPFVYLFAWLVVCLVGWLSALVQSGQALSFLSVESLAWTDHPKLESALLTGLGEGEGRAQAGREQSSPALHPCRYSEEETRQKVRTFRQMLMEKEGMLTREDRPGGHM